MLGIVFIIGALFVFLSLEKKYNKIVALTPPHPLRHRGALLSAGIVCLTLGTIFLVRAQKIRFNAREEIERLASLRQKKQSSSDFATKCDGR